MRRQLGNSLDRWAGSWAGDRGHTCCLPGVHTHTHRCTRSSSLFQKGCVSSFVAHLNFFQKKIFCNFFFFGIKPLCSGQQVQNERAVNHTGSERPTTFCTKKTYQPSSSEPPKTSFIHPQLSSNTSVLNTPYLECISVQSAFTLSMCKGSVLFVHSKAPKFSMKQWKLHALNMPCW